MHWLSLPLQLRTFKVMRNETNSSVCARLCSYIYASWHVNTSDIIDFLPRHNMSEASRLIQIQIKLSPPPKWSSAWKSKHWVSRFPELRTGRLWSSAFTQSKRKNRANNLSEIRQWLLMHLGKQARKVMRIFKMQQLQIDGAMWMKLRGLQVVWWNSRLARRDKAREEWTQVLLFGSPLGNLLIQHGISLYTMVMD